MKKVIVVMLMLICSLSFSDVHNLNHLEKNLKVEVINKADKKIYIIFRNNIIESKIIYNYKDGICINMEVIEKNKTVVFNNTELSKK